MSSVQEALEKRKKKQNSVYQERKNRVDSAVDAYKKRKQLNSQKAVTDITNRINSEIEAIKGVETPSWGAGSLGKTLESTRNSRLNVEKLQREVESYKNYLDENTYKTLSSTVTGLRDSYNSFLDNAEVMEQFDSESSYNTWYDSYKKRQEERKPILEADDFEAKKGYTSTKTEDTWEKMWSKYGMGYGDLTYEYINNQNNLRDEIKSKHRAYSSDNMFAEDESDFEQKGYDYLTDEEISIYNYYYNKQGKNKAQSFLDSLEDELVQRKAGKEFQPLKGNTLAEIFYGVYAGVNQFRQGVENLGSMITGDKGFTPSSQYVSGMVRDDLADDGFKILGSSIGQIGYDFLNTSANMLPSILVGAVTGGIGGAATLGASAMGNGYAEMRKLGYDEDQARGYGLLVGASEAVLSYALGGISKLGGGGKGIFQTVASKIVPKLDNAIARVAIEVGGNMLDEGLEEAVQEVLDPIFKMAVTGEDFEGIDLENVLYSGLLGMLTAGVMEGAPTIAQNVGSSINANKIYGSDVGELITESLEINPDNVHALRMQDRLNAGQNVSGYQINRLVEANESAMRDNDIVSIENSAAQRLMELGETDDVNTVARAIAKQASGQKLKRSEQKLINESVYGERVANELNTDNIRSGEYSSDWAQKIDTNRINVEEYSKLVNASQIAQNSENKAEVQTAATAPKIAETKAVEAPESVTEEVQPAAEIKADVTDSKADVPDNGTVDNSPSVQEAESEEASNVSLEKASEKYGAQSGAMINTYVSGQDVAKYDMAYKMAYDMGMSGVSLDYAMNDESTEYLSESQRQLAYEAGQAASNAKASEQDTLNKSAANGNTARKRGVVKGEGVTIDDLVKTFNDPQRKAYKILSTIADVTGIDIVLYKSEANEKGEFEGAQGRFKWSEDTIYIDINAGIKNLNNVGKLAKYSMLRTFSHEFTHFLEKWNPLVYNEFRKVVFDELRARGENVNDLISLKQKDGLNYDKASREVVAEAMTDILPESSFVQELAENHKNIFEKLLEKLKEFVNDLKEYFNSLAKNPSREANALKEQIGDTLRYAENIVKMFDEMAVQGVENYQATVATEEADPNGLTSSEEDAIMAYKSGGSYFLNAKLRANAELSEYEQGIVDNLDSALKKLPTFKGTVYRNIQFDGLGDKEARDAYIEEHIIGEPIFYDAYTSTSTAEDGYVLDGEFVVHHVIQSVNGRNMETYGNNFESEVLFSRDANYITDRIEYDSDGTPTIYLTEVSNEQQRTETETANGSGTQGNVSGNTAGKSGQHETPDISQASQVQRLPTHDSENSEVQPVVSERNTDRDTSQQNDLQGLQTEVTHENEHFTITDNTEYGSLEIKFDEKPSEAVRDVLKENKFRWNRTKGVWYGKADRGALTEALNKAYEIVSEEESVAEESAADVSEKTVTPSEKLADMLLDGYINAENINRGGKALTSKELYALADEAFEGTQAEGTYDRKDAYDAMELAVNKFLLKEAERAHKSFNGTADSAVSTVEFLQDMLDLLPTQNVRTKEMEDFQQFSTPPNIAYLATWAANIKNTDFALEPSAGIGGLAVFAKAYGAEVAVNELSKRRLEVLRAMGFDHLFNENAEHIDNILPENISPSVVIMNPPFSSTAGRTANNKTSNAEKHIDQALARLREGGRLVAILGKGMNNNDYYQYWDKLRKNYSIRANLSIDGSNYKKYGTTYDVQIVVIDKTGAQTGETVTGKYTDLTEIPYVLEDIRNDRRYVEENRVASSDNGIRESVPDGDNKQSDTGHNGIGERSDGSTSNTKPKKNRKGAETDSGAGNRANLEGSEKVSGQEIGSEDGRGIGDIGRTDIGDSNGAVESSVSDRHQPELPLSRLNDTNETEEVSDDGVYATFVAPDIPIKGGKKHPAVLVESAAMAAVSMPKATYKVKLPADVISNNLSDAQLVTVTYAGQAHEQKLPDGRRKGFFIGDGTGVGKGRQIAGIILDNFMQGRDKAVWISKNDDLYGDAVRDWTATTGRSKDEVVSQGKFKPKDSITLKNGVLFTSYGKLKMEKGGSRLDQIVNWLGEDFDGVIAFDEAHFMGNLFGKKGKFGKSKGSLTAQAGVELQRRLPNARIVYVSATAATEVDNLAYAERIGLWGQGTAFTNAQDFISKIGASGLAAMELVIRDMKAMGVYVARSISYNGVNYDTVEHALDPMQTQIYNTMSRAWQKTMSNVQSALETTGGKYNSTERQKALGNFYSGMQRFYNQVLTSMSMPSVIADMRRELDAGHSCVLQIVNTNEAQQNKQLAEAKANGESLDNLDLTPREALVGYLMNSFPTQMFEEYTDDDGNLRSRPVMDSAGNPVQNKEAIRQRDALVAEVNQMSIPDGPLEMLFDAFGPDQVAENTGRSRRVVPKKMSDGSVTRVEESRSLNHRTADVQAFQDGKKRILVFSDAGGTGKSYHADRSEKNQQLRIHYVLQPGWVASNAVQGFGRTHRSNEASAPVYKLVTTNIKGQKRFTSTIARRLDQLGALTKGQRDTGSGMFGAKDNLETDLAKDSLREFYRRLGKNVIEGIDGMKILDRLGLKEKFTDEFGAFKINENIARDISTFLNRILALEVDEQNVVFDAFISIYEMELEAAIQSGTLDTGMENVKADKIEVVDEKVIRKDKNTGSETRYIQAKTYTKPKVVTTVAEMSKRRDGFVGFYKTESGAVRAVFRIADKTTEWGEVQKQFRLVSPNLGAKTSVWNENTLKSKAEAIDKAEWQKEWDSEVAKVPEYNEDTLHMLTGALLPIWNSLPQEGSTKVKRLVAHDGSTYLGRVIDNELIDGVLNRFSVDRTKEVFTAQQVMDKAIKNGTRFYLTNNRVELFRSKVSGEWRLEISQPYNAWFLTKTYPGLIQERIQYRDRYFIPVGDKGIAILEKLLQDNPVRNTADDTEQYQSRAYLSDDTVQYQERTNPLTDEEVLELAAWELYNKGDLSEAERDALSIFQDRIGKLTELQSKRAEQGRIYKEQQFGAEVDREAAAETLSRMRILDSRIKKASEEVLSVENKAIFKSVLQKARKVVETKQWEHDQEVLRRWRDRRKNAEAIKKYRDRLRKDVDELSNWVTHPNNKDIVKHIPDALKNSVIPFLSSINFISKRALNGGNPTAGDKEFMKRLNGLQAALKNNIDINGMYSGYNDLPPDFMENLETFIKSAQALVDNNNGEFIINKMTSEEIKELSKVVRALKKYIMQMNRFHNNAMFQHVYEAGDDSIHHMALLNPAENTGKISNFVLWQQIRPAYAFERFGKGGMAIYDGLRRGQAQLAFNTKEIEAFAKKAYTEAEVKAWEDDIKSFRLGGDNVQVPVSYIMGLYELSKDPDALNHIGGEGIRIATYTRKGKKISDKGHTLTRSDLDRMIGTLTQRQKDVADALQKYMAEQGGKWGNYVSVARFGEELFTNPKYYPINSDGRHLQSTADEHPSAASLYALLNMSFTKSRKEDAKNRIVVYSIFDVFANHMASMAQYNAFALPILDAIKWFNYQQVIVDEHGNKTVVDSVRERMTRAFGVPEETRPGSGKEGYAETFVKNIIKAFNGTEAQGSPMDATGLKSLRRYNMAQIAYNFRVVVQQPLAITRAALLLDYGSIVKGMRLKPAAIKKNIEEMQKYSGIAAWKSLGFYDVNISRGVTDIIKHESKFGDKVRNIGMWGAEKMDILTWAGMWSAAKEEVMLKQHLRPESDGFYEAVTKLFEDVIYKTQVVDSVLTKNEFMRDKGFFARAIGSFMSEPTTTASMLIDAYDKYQMDMQRGMSVQQAWNNNKEMIGRVALVYAISQVMLAAVQSIPDAFRDDDDYQEWYEKWLEAFTGNLIDELNLFNKLPIISDVYEVVEAIAAPHLKEWWGIDVYSNPPQTLYMQWQDTLVKGYEIVVDKIKGADTDYTWYAGIYKLLQAASGAVGLPMAAATRELITAWNNTIGAMAPSLKVKTYDPGEKSEIKYAYLDGYLTSEEAIEQLISQELVDTEDEAYWTVEGWGKEGYSKYDNIISVVRNGGNINSAMAELTSHGLTEREVLSVLKSQIGSWYKDGEITKQQAINSLDKYFDMGDDEITALVNKWSSKVVTGIDYDDIKDEYLSGKISAARAIEMRVLYGGESREKATQKVNEWKAFKDTGIEYGEIKEAFMDGDISAAQAKQMYMEYGGKSAKEAAETVSVMEFVKEHPETEGISYAAVEDYTMYCEAVGIPAEVFYDIWKYNNEISADVDATGKAISGSKKTKVLQYINSLRLTSVQKDSLYYAFGWAQSKINEAPWR